MSRIDSIAISGIVRNVQSYERIRVPQRTASCCPCVRPCISAGAHSIPFLSLLLDGNANYVHLSLDASVRVHPSFE